MKSKGFRRIFQLLCWEGAFALALETWVGPTYLAGLAGELRIDVGLVSLLAAAPWIGSVGQLLGLWFLGRVPSLKSYTLRVATAARSLWLVPMFFAGFFALRQYREGAAFPVNTWFAITAGIACAYSLLATSSAAAWQSWTLSLVPARFRGRFYGFRQRFVMGAIILAHLLASYWVGWRPGGYYAGFAALALLAIVAATLSTWLLSRVPESRAASASPQRFGEAVREPLRDPAFRRVLFFGAAFHGALQLAGSYFPYFLTRELDFPMRTVAVWSLLTSFGCLVAAGFWGRKIDRSRDPSRVLRITASWMAVAPLLYVFAGRGLLAWAGPLEYFVSGVAFSGYVLGLANVLFAVVPRERNAAYFSVFTAGCGIAGALAALLGGRLAVWLEPVGGFRALWGTAVLVRLAVLVALSPGEERSRGFWRFRRFKPAFKVE
ncbi:MAG: MFS transporter [Oligoflexia bacterium]|nr:MFS transporter [Oligoflexia bacterium]